MKEKISAAYERHLKAFKKGFFTFDEISPTDTIIRKTEGETSQALREFLEETGAENTAKIIFYSEKNNYASKIGHYIFEGKGGGAAPDAEQKKYNADFLRLAAEMQEMKTAQIKEKEAAQENARQKMLSELKKKISELEKDNEQQKSVAHKFSLIATQVAENILKQRTPQIARTLSGLLPKTMQEGLAEIISPPTQQDSANTLAHLDEPTQEMLTLFMQMTTEEKEHYLELVKKNIAEHYEHEKN